MHITKIVVVVAIGLAVPAEEARAQTQSSSQREISTRVGERIDVDGIAEFRDDDTLTVSGFRVRAVAATKFAGKDIASLSAVPLGFAVEAKGIVQSDGTIAVQELKAHPRDRSDAGRGVVAGALDQEGKWLAGGGSIFRAALEANAVETRLPKADPQYERVSGILVRLAPASLEESLRLHIVNSLDWNARGLPNGSIAVANGLLADMDDDEVAIVLGHELAHVTHQHAQKTLADAERRKLVTQLLTDLVPDGGVITRLALTVGGAVSLHAWQSGYSRSLETEADRVGLSYAAAGGFDVRKAPRVWERFQEKYGDEQAVKNFVVGKHPRNVERAKNARAELSAFYPGYVPPAGALSQPAPAPAPIRVEPATEGAPLSTGGNQLAPDHNVAPVPPTREITKGMTQEQVRALLGEPKEEFLFTTAEGRSTKWVFAHLKVTFLDGAVTTVEF